MHGNPMTRMLAAAEGNSNYHHQPQHYLLMEVQLMVNTDHCGKKKSNDD